MSTTPASPSDTEATDPYRPEFAEQARKLCLLLGACDDELARFFGVTPDVLQSWLRERRDFATAVKSGQALADAEVADRLHRRATGYSHDAVKIFSHQGHAIEIPYVEHYPPDTAAAVFWLKSRQPERWRDRGNDAAASTPVTDDDLLARLDAAGERARHGRG